MPAKPNQPNQLKPGKIVSIAKKLSNRQFIRFASVGVINTAVDVGIFVLLYNILDQNLLVANTVSTSVALIVGYILHSNYTFQNAQTSKRTFVIFLTVTLLGLWVLQPLVILGLTPVFEANPIYSTSHSVAILIAKFGSIAATLVWNFLLYSRVVFRTAPTTSGTS